MQEQGPAKAGAAFSFDEVVERERQVIAAQRRNRGAGSTPPGMAPAVLGLALSGGGIRSASFALGVLQCLQANDKLKQFDYLSTVSGGGYIGGSLTWFHHQLRTAHREPGDAAPMTPQEYRFPFGSKYFVRRAMDCRSPGAGSTPVGVTEEAADDTSFLRHLGNYLSHGAEISMMSLVAVLLRNVLLAFGVYFTLFLAVTLVVEQLFGEHPLRPAWLLFAFFLLTCVIYGWASFGYTKYLPESDVLYRWRIRSQQLQGAVLTLAVLCFIAGSIHWFHEWLRHLPWAGFVSLSGTGIAGVLLEVLKQQRPQLGRLLGRYGDLLALVGAGAAIYAIMFGAYALALQVPPHWEWPLAALLLAGSVAVGGFLNLNLFGLGRMYRDRLMETFMPNRESVEARQWGLATEADVTFLKDVCDTRDYGPYLIVNTNVVLTSSNEAEYRGRGGDNFTMSSQHCGGDAIGWHRTADFIGGSMSLATAVAISGAALNPDAACGGEGITRNRLSSFLLSLFNLRLGYWVRNPVAPPFAAGLAQTLWPNLVYPGIRQGLLGTGLNERAGFVQLSDGGHFENTGIYELVRRGVDLIVLSLASADEHYRYEDFADAIERVRVDFGVYIQFRDALKDTLPHAVVDGGLESALRLSDRAHAVADVIYPDNGLYRTQGGATQKTGTLIVLKSALLANLPLDVVAYGARNAAFPNQSTADQYFDERQFEAYREAGYAACWKMLQEEGERLKPFFPVAGPAPEDTENAWV